VPEAILYWLTDAGPSRYFGRFSNPFSILGVNLFERRRAIQFSGCVAQHLLIRQAVEYPSAVDPDNCDQIRCIFADESE
jgi:hypothetical protein